MAALQIEVSGVSQNVTTLVSVDSPVSAPTTLSTNTNFISNVTNLVTVNNPVVSAATALVGADNFLGKNISNIIVIEGLGTSLGGAVAEPVSKESWE